MAVDISTDLTPGPLVPASSVPAAREHGQSPDGKGKNRRRRPAEENNDLRENDESSSEPDQPVHQIDRMA
jgi:hypothetical protein